MFLPVVDDSEFIDLGQPIEDRPPLCLINFLPAQVVIAPFHVGDSDRAADAFLKEGEVFVVELFLEILGPGRDDDALAARDDGDQVGERLSGSRPCFDNQVPLLGKRSFNLFGHGELAGPKLVLRVPARQQPMARKEVTGACWLSARLSAGLTDFVHAGESDILVSVRRADAARVRALGDVRTLGLEKGEVRLVAYCAEWASFFAEEEARLRRALLRIPCEIEHVGSTSVPGLCAKPILDIAVGVAEGRLVATAVFAIRELGYEYVGDAGPDGGHVLVRESEARVRTHHVHVVELADPQWAAYMSFRDLLRRKREAREAYAAEKTVLAGRHSEDREAYTAAKDEIVRRLLLQARQGDGR